MWRSERLVATYRGAIVQELFALQPLESLAFLKLMYYETKSDLKDTLKIKAFDTRGFWKEVDMEIGKDGRLKVDGSFFALTADTIKNTNMPVELNLKKVDDTLMLWLGVYESVFPYKIPKDVHSAYKENTQMRKVHESCFERVANLKPNCVIKHTSFGDEEECDSQAVKLGKFVNTLPPPAKESNAFVVRHHSRYHRSR